MRSVIRKAQAGVLSSRCETPVPVSALREEDPVHEKMRCEVRSNGAAISVLSATFRLRDSPWHILVPPFYSAA